MVTAYLSLGSNIEPRIFHIVWAVEHVQSDLVCVTGISPLYETEPVGHDRDTSVDYLNAVVRIETDLDPEALWDHLSRVEAVGGRVRSFRFAPRTIDIDIILYGSGSHKSDRLSIPHPRAHERAFVLKPLFDLDPAHEFLTVQGITEKEVNRLVSTQVVRPYAPPDSWLALISSLTTCS